MRALVMLALLFAAGGRAYGEDQKLGSLGPTYALSLAPILDPKLGFELSAERALGRHWGLRLFGGSRNNGYFSDPSALRAGGGLALRHYWFKPERLNGLYLELHGAFYHFQEAGFFWDDPSRLLTFNASGPGLELGWQAALGPGLLASLGYRFDWLFPLISVEEENQEIFAPSGRIRGDAMFRIGWVF